MFAPQYCENRCWRWRPGAWPPRSETSYSDATPRHPRSRSTSPTKRFQTTESLLGLAVPIRFTKVPALRDALPADARPLLEALSAFEAGEALLPAALQSHPDFQEDPRIRRRAWSDETQSVSAAELAAALHNHQQLRRIIDKSVASANKHRSEAAWNNLVHTPLLEHATRHMPHHEVELTASAQIMPAFHPLLASGAQVPLPSSETTDAGSSSSSTMLSHAASTGYATASKCWRRPAWKPAKAVVILNSWSSTH